MFPLSLPEVEVILDLTVQLEEGPLGRASETVVEGDEAALHVLVQAPSAFLRAAGPGTMG